GRRGRLLCQQAGHRALLLRPPAAARAVAERRRARRQRVAVPAGRRAVLSEPRQLKTKGPYQAIRAFSFEARAGRVRWAGVHGTGDRNGSAGPACYGRARAQAFSLGGIVDESVAGALQHGDAVVADALVLVGRVLLLPAAQQRQRRR